MTATSSTSMHPPADPVVWVTVRRRRWPWTVAWVAVFVVVAWWWAVPALLAVTLVDRLRQAGFRNVEVGAVEVGFDRVRVQDVQLDAAGGRASIPSAVATFALGDLWHARVDTLVLAEPTWTIGAALANVRDEKERPDERDDPVDAALPHLPVRRVEVHGARVVPPDASKVPAVVVDATLALDGAQWDVSARAAAGDEGVHVTARLAVQPERAAGSVALRALGPRPLDLEGTVAVAVADGARVVDVELSRGDQVFDVPLGGTNWSGEGAFALALHAPLAQLAASTLCVCADDMRLEGAGLQIDGLTVDVSLRGLPAPVTDGVQKVRWHSAKVAEVAAGSGDAAIELGPGLELFAVVTQRAADEIGAITTSRLRLAPGARTIPATVKFDRMPLREWLEALSGGRVTGDGRVSGDVELVILTAPRFGIELCGGQLAADEGGSVRFLEDAETEELIRAHVAQIAQASGHDNLVEERLVGALEDFVYEDLAFRIVRDAKDDGVTLRVHTSGKGRKVPQQISLDVNLNGFDAAVDTALAVKLGLDRAKRRLDEKIDEPTNPNGPRKP